MPSRNSTTAVAEPTRRAARTAAEWDELAINVIVPALAGGTSMTEIRAQYGAGPKIREVLWRNGYGTNGQPLEIPTVKPTGKTGAQAVARLRAQLKSWRYIGLATGASETELKALLAANGYTEAGLVDGRVTRTVGNEAIAKLAAARKRARKPKATAAA